jgi:signal peptidase I
MKSDVDQSPDQRLPAKSRLSIAPILIGLVFGSPTMFLWLGRWRLAAGYLAASFALLAAIIFAAVEGWIPPSLLSLMDIEYTLWSVLLALLAVACFHVTRLDPMQGPKPWYSRWYVALLLIPALSLGAAFLVRTFLYQPFSSPSASGEPNLMIGDYFFVSKTAYGRHPPERGDIAVFKTSEGIDYVKRVIGLPGERIQMRGGVLFIDGTAVKMEPAELPEAFHTHDNETFFRETLPNGRSHVVANTDNDATGDNTEEFAVPDGHYFMMGDNRDNSLDSRFDGPVGFVPRESFIGPMVFRFWNSQGFPLNGRPD